MNDQHMPNPEFVNHLEWELESVIRRQDAPRTEPCGSNSIRPRRLTMAALILVSMFLGGAGTYAATRNIDSHAAALYFARAEARLEIAKTQKQHFASELLRMQDLAEQNLVTQREVRQAEAGFVEAEAEVETRQLDLDETTISFRAPNDALSAPLVGGRDFVTQRLNARRRPLQVRLSVMNEQVRRIQDLVADGVASERELKAAEAPMLTTIGELADLDKRIELRSSFLSGELSATQVELEGMRLSAETARAAAARHLDLLAEQHNRMADLVQRGMASQAELQKMDLALLAARKQVELADLELRIIEEKLANLPRE